MGAGDLSFFVAVVATGASVAVLMAFGFIRRRDTMAWDTGVHGGGTHTDLPTLTDPDIARRIASLVREPIEPATDDAPADLDPAGDENGSGAPLEAGQLASRLDDWPVEDRTLPDPSAALPGLVAGWGLADASALAAADLSADPVADRPVAPDREVLARLLVDPLTGLGTSLAWDMWIADEEPRVRRYGRPSTIVLAELDGLDAVDAFHGPEVAEGAAAMIGAAFRANIRSSDRAAVVGPGIYAILLPETDEVRAVNFVERVRATCEEWLAVNSPSVRLLLGWASPDGDGLAGAWAVAERRLERERH